MGVRVLTDRDTGEQCLYCSTTMVAFGNIFSDEEDAYEFLQWLPKDARLYTDKELENKIYEWRKERGD